MPLDRAAARDLESLAGPGGERRCASGAELLPVAIGLLEVVPDELVELDELGAVLLEPVGELLVQLGPLRLRQPSYAASRIRR